MTPDAHREAWINKARAVPIESELARRNIKLLNGKVERAGPCPKCGGDDRFSINTNKGVFNCRQCGGRGDVIDFVQWLDGVNFMEACTTLAGPSPAANGKDTTAAPPREILVGKYTYRDESGAVLFAVGRYEYQNPDGSFVLKGDKHKKEFRQKRPDPNKRGGWIPNVQGIRIVPYRLPEVIEAIGNDHPIYIVEGEGKVDLLASWNLTATCNAGGAKHWKPEHAAFLKDAADVILVPDNDDIGWEHAHIVGNSLVSIAKRVRVLLLPGLAPKGDIIDWAAAGGTREQLNELIDKAPDWKSLDDLKDILKKEKKADAARSEDELLDALAKMPKGIRFGRERKLLAKALGVSQADVDAEIQARQLEAETHCFTAGGLLSRGLNRSTATL